VEKKQARGSGIFHLWKPDRQHDFLTDCPGGVWKKISFETHGNIDPGVSALVASFPNVLGFSKESESKLFQSMGIGLAAVRSLTNFDEGSSNAETRHKAA
jgi:hypothetical protein